MSSWTKGSFLVVTQNMPYHYLSNPIAIDECIVSLVRVGFRRNSKIEHFYFGFLFQVIPRRQSQPFVFWSLISTVHAVFWHWMTWVAKAGDCSLCYFFQFKVLCLYALLFTILYWSGGKCWLVCILLILAQSYFLSGIKDKTSRDETSANEEGFSCRRNYVSTLVAKHTDLRVGLWSSPG